MKGIIFTEFIELIEEKFSEDMADQLIDECNLASGGAYTSVGVYDHQEIIELVAKLSQVTSLPVKDLLITFGKHLAVRFSVIFPEMFESNDLFSFLESIHDHVHVEVKKLYPEAELPELKSQIEDRTLTFKYSSSRPFADLAFGLIQGAIEYYGEHVKLSRNNDISDIKHSDVFTLEKV